MAALSPPWWDPWQQLDLPPVGVETGQPRAMTPNAPARTSTVGTKLATEPPRAVLASTWAR